MYSRLVEMPFGKLCITSTSPDYLGSSVLGHASYNRKFSDSLFTLKINTGDGDGDGVASYRQEMLRRGIYLGHHHGMSVKMKSEKDTLSISLHYESPDGYNKIIWTYAMKYVFTIMALRYDALHLKATTLIKEGRAILLLGRGKSGKTTLASYLAQVGFNHVGNTHAMIKDEQVWAINSWKRIRRSDGNETYELCDNVGIANGKLVNIYVVDFNREGNFHCSELDFDMAFSFLLYFGGATGNYDLKEDLFDYNMTESFSKRMSFLVKEISLIRQLLRNNKIYYLSADIQNPDCANVVGQYFQSRIYS
ncbi:hypothetical protein [Paenibacillus medicaginis]|uniref:Uncharacterized protein n=1 Tax=Paenibacillus medicaginis TaxID=1470560 RepID=A0ABV5C6F2_9BACL